MVILVVRLVVAVVFLSGCGGCCGCGYSSSVVQCSAPKRSNFARLNPESKLAPSSAAPVALVMQPLSGNQRPDLFISLLDASLLLRLP